MAMELQTITEVTRNFNISTRTLRYYEQIGLIQSMKKEDYAYRTYNQQALLQLQQIIILRKLRIPLKQIKTIIQSEHIHEILASFQQNIKEIEDELTALSTIRSILNTLVKRLSENTDIKFKLNLLDDISLVKIVDSLTVSKQNLKEDKNMDDIKKANETLGKLTDKEVRIVYLPPATVATYQYSGEEPEMQVNQVMDQFVRDYDLVNKKPDLRHYGFNAPNPIDETGYHGYEMWVTIPADMEVPNPLVKKEFEGGLYAAHMIPFGAFEEWDWLTKWVENSPNYKGNFMNKGYECMYGCLEEHLNYVSHVKLQDSEPEGMQLDLLIPVIEK
jgi:DNA-binding transcriptional MerR regulator